MPIDTIQFGSNNRRSILAAPANQAKRTGDIQDQRFAAMLDNQLLTSAEYNSGQGGLPPPDDTSQTTPIPSPGLNNLIPLGKLDKNTPSISHLLTGNTAYQHKSWDILAAEVNKNKQFTKIQRGAVVSLNPTNNELVWAESQSHPRSIGSSVKSLLHSDKDLVQSLLSPDKDSIPSTRARDSVQQPPAGHEDEIDTLQADKKPAAGPIPLGTLDADNPTLSHLLKNNPQYSGNTWNIIFSPVNHNKPYTSLRPGCQVSINPQTLELSFEQNDDDSARPVLTAARSGATPQAKPAEIVDGQSQRQFSEKLAESVKAYLGQPYQEIDCYGLVVKGLKDQGVQYGGSGGLLYQLERMASRHGLPANAYLNGEGLIEIAGNKLYDQSFSRIKDAKRQSNEVMEQLEPLLQEGMLLSFSTPSRGHTGVIAKKDGQWTYVNSGMIDHQVNGGKISKRVGEENLEEEIKNWFVMAKHKRTSLKVSAGLFDTQKLKTKGHLLANSKANDHDMI